eukprot:gene28976-32164_t
MPPRHLLSPECQKEHWPSHKSVCKGLIAQTEMVMGQFGKEAGAVFAEKLHVWTMASAVALSKITNVCLLGTTGSQVVVLFTDYDSEEKPHFTAAKS